MTNGRTAPSSVHILALQQKSSTREHGQATTTLEMIILDIIEYLTSETYIKWRDSPGHVFM